MNARPLPSDASLQAMLARRAGHAVPEGLADDIRSAVEATPQGHRPATTWLLPPVGVDPAIRRAWIVALAALLLVALTAAALVGSELVRRPELAVIPPPSVVPVPSFVPAPTVAPSPAPALVSERPIDRINELAFAPDGTAWLATVAGVVHWDVTAGTASLYGQNEGLPTTEAAHVAIASDGTVWASGWSGWVARFDGTWTVFTQFGSTTPASDLGDIAVGEDGVLWLAVTDASTGGAVLLRYDGSWRASTVAEPPGTGPWAFELEVASDGSVWAGYPPGGVARFDGTTWTTYTQADTGLPRAPELAGVARDGSVWALLGAEGCVAARSGDTCTAPAAGVARFDGARWSVYTTADGLPGNDVDLVVGEDGSVWATASGKVARFGGAGWTNVEMPEAADADAAAVAPDGALWLSSPEGYLRYDGDHVTRLSLPAIERPSDLPPLELTLVARPTVTESALGRITWRVYQTTPARLLWILTSTDHGPVAIDGPDLRWLSPSGTWGGATTGSDVGFRMATDGDHLYVYGRGEIRLSWDGTRWVGSEPLDMPGSFGFVDGMTLGPKGAVAVGGGGVAYSTDGVHFAMAARGPGTFEPASSASPAQGRAIGPVLATQDGFVALVPGAGSASEPRGPFWQPDVWHSTDGSTWLRASTASPFGKDAYVTEVASRDGRHVAIGYVGTYQAPGAVWVSDDGLTWERLPDFESRSPCDANTQTSECDTRFLDGVTAVEDGWAIIARSGAVWMSADGRSWEPLRGWPALHGGYIEPFLAMGPDTVVASGYLPGTSREVIAVGRIEH